jgi:prepilin peptidase CpaA
VSPHAFIAFNVLLVCAAICDLRSYRIPNALPALLALSGLLLAPPETLAEAASRAGSVALVAAVAGLLWLRRIIGGGDLKLLVACAVWAPLGALPVLAVALGLASGVQGLATLAMASARTNLASGSRKQLAYALSIAAAGVIWSVPRLATA